MLHLPLKLCHSALMRRTTPKKSQNVQVSHDFLPQKCSESILSEEKRGCIYLIVSSLFAMCRIVLHCIASRSVLIVCLDSTSRMLSHTGERLALCTIYVMLLCSLHTALSVSRHIRKFDIGIFGNVLNTAANKSIAIQELVDRISPMYLQYWKEQAQFYDTNMLQI